MEAMKSEYGPEKGEHVFYGAKNKGTISGVDDDDKDTMAQRRFDDLMEKVHGLGKRCDAIEARFKGPAPAPGVVTSPAVKDDDDCDTRHDDRSPEEHAQAAKFHEEEAARGDGFGGRLTTPTGGTILK
jgi:hypothetical protein